MSDAPTFAPRWADLENAARFFRVSEKTIRRWIGLGYFSYAENPTGRGILVDLNEAEREMRKRKPAQARTRFNQYGPKAVRRAFTPGTTYSPPEVIR